MPANEPESAGPVRRLHGTMGRRWFPSTRLLLPALLLASCSAPGVAQPATSSGAPPPRATATLEFTPTPRPTPTPSGPLTEIKLACLGPQSGDLAFLGKPSLQACQMAVDDFNARTGGIDGLKVQPVAVDGQAQPAVAREQAAHLAADRAVLGVVGPMAGSAALAAGPVLDAAHVGFVSQSASLPKITDSGWKTAHRLAAGDDAVGAAAAV
ncbi:MAG TPA: ABC transporter substrate-binding protein, partial [Chloroflexota bacterium]|nr:ABC transporter substrate-binding protein [Chloroflexota bacterium]